MAGYLHSYLGHLDPALKDARVIEVVVNADGNVWVERAGETHMEMLEDLWMTPDRVTDLAQQIANGTSNQFGNDHPILSASVEYEGLTLRAQALTAPAVDAGTILAFRVFRPRKASGEQPKTFELLRKSDVSLEDERRAEIVTLRKLAATDLEGFLRALVERRMNVVVSGGTSTGKTELGRKLLAYVPTHERVITIEDSLELLPSQPNALTLIAQRAETSPRSAAKLLQACLRLRPDRIILGELRGEEAVTFLDAINTGHGGSFTTLHAETARKALDRLALLVLGSGSRLTYAEVIRYLEGSIDVIVQMGRDGPKRGIVEIYIPGQT